MFRFYRGIFLLLVLHLTIDSIGCQVLLVPKKFYINEPNKFLVISDINTTARLQISLSKEVFSHPIYEDQVIFESGKLREENIELRGEIASKISPNQEKIYIKLDFGNQVQVIEELFLGENGLFFFQTDKPIYRTRETVKFRLLRLNHRMNRTSSSCIVRIKNHQGIKLDEAKLETFPPKFIADYSFTLPNIAKSGNWTAELSCDPHPKDVIHKTQFKVEEYVTQRFNAKIVVPPMVLCPNTNQPTFLPVKINVTYTFGKPVNCSLFLKFRVTRDSKTRLVETTSTLSASNGKLQYNFKDVCNKIPFQFPAYVFIEATVSDLAEGTRKVFTTFTKVTKTAYKINLQNTVFTYKPKVANYYTFEVVNFIGEPVKNIPVNVDLRDPYGKKIEVYIVNNDNSQFTFLLSINKNIGDLTVELRTADPKFSLTGVEQGTTKFLLKPYNRHEKDYLLIVNKKQLYYVAKHKYRSTVVIQGNITGHLFLAVLSKGVLIQSQEIQVQIQNNNKIGEFEITLTNQMAPFIRILVLGFTKEGVIVADSFRIFVEQDSQCGVRVELAANRTTYEPGGNVTFHMSGNLGDIVGLSAVDETVYLVRNTRDHAKLEYNNRLLQSDVGVGTGSGNSTFYTIHDTGFKILTPKSVAKLVRKRSINPEENHPCCLLAYSQTTVRQTCEEKRQILKGRMNLIQKFNSDKNPKIDFNNCPDIFFECCKKNKGSNTRFQASATSQVRLNESSRNGLITELNPDDEKYSKARHDFRDSWLFDLVELHNNTQQYTSTLPHSITSWVVSSISLTKQDGFCFNSDLSLTVYRPFFVDINLPQSLVQQEKSDISVTIFNYHHMDLWVNIYFYRHNAICSEALFTNDHIVRTTRVPSNSNERITFAIIPIESGIFPISVKAITHLQQTRSEKSDIFYDYVIRNLTVFPLGIEQQQSVLLSLDPKNRAKRQTTSIVNKQIVDKIFPDKNFQNTSIDLTNNTSSLNVVPGTLRHQLILSGQRFVANVSSSEDLNELIQKPKGCGEQNMYYMAFNLYSMKYMSKIDKLSDKVKRKGVKYLRRAVKQQVSFRKDDGSFSAFRRRNSSVWLTAFVSKVFCQAREFMGNEDLDSRIVTDALRWLGKKQHSTGYWLEEYPILHTKALGGVNGRNTLTAYILIALNECRQYLNDLKSSDSSESLFDAGQFKHTLDEMIQKAKRFVQSHLSFVKQDDSYSYIMAHYAISLNETMSKKRDTLSSIYHNLTSFADFNRDEMQKYMFWNNDYPVETTSYALLFLSKIEINRMEIADLRMETSNWLVSQQKRGAFDNTQDTVVALEALATYHSTSGKINDHQLRTNILFNSRPKRFIEFTEHNIDLTHIVEVDKNTSHIVIETNGTGFGKVELLTTYNIYQPENVTCFYDLDITINNYRVPSTPNNTRKNTFNPNEFFNDDTLNAINIKSSNRSKRHLKGWLDLHKRLTNRYPNIFSYQTLQDTTRRPEAPPAECEFDELPELGLRENSVIRRLNVCIQHLSKSRENGMVILDVGLFSGYQVVESDLKRLLKMSNTNEGSPFLQYYEILYPKILFYFRSVPNARKVCSCFRVYQKHQVDHVQHALVKVYNYYDNRWQCSRLYSDLTPNYLNFMCDKQNQGCQCVQEKYCPNNKELDNIIHHYNKNIEDARKKFTQLLTRYTDVVRGFIKSKQSHPYNDLPILTVERIDNLRGTFFELSFNIILNTNCTNLIMNENDSIMLMVNSTHFNKNDKYLLLDGRSIFYSLGRNSERKIDDLQHHYSYYYGNF